MSELGLLDEALARGIITPAQRAAILALGADRAAAGPPSSGEAPRGFNGVTVAYTVGAVAVLFAFAWFLFERWSALGAVGVLAVSLVYAAMFAVAARLLARQGFQTASAVATLLVVGMTPVVTWAVLALTGLWYEPPTMPPLPTRALAAAERTRWLPIELATIAVASLTLWRTRVGLLTLPIAVGLLFAGLHCVPLLFDATLAARIDPWMAMFIGSVLLLSGYAAEQRQTTDRDYAQWLYVVALAALVYGLGDLWSLYRGAIPHIVAAFSIGAFVVSLYLRRKVFLVFGACGAVAYLAYLAFDVFRRTLGFSIVLAGFGLTLIVLTVWLQRRYPALVQRIAAQQGTTRPAIPGGYPIFGLAALLTLVLLLTAAPRARRAQAALDERNRQAVQPPPAPQRRN